MKKLSIIFIFMLVILASTGVFAENEVRTTDICAYINNFPVATYNLNNQNAVYASGLRKYGFDVTWNDEERRVDISLSDEDIKGPDETILRDELTNAGRVISSAKDTDIVTYIDGKKVESFNIDGYTVIYFKELKIFGEINWDAKMRIAMLTIDEKNETEFEEAPYKYDLATKVPTLENITGELKRETEHISLSSVVYKYNGEDINLEQVAKYTLLMKKCGFVCLDDPDVPEDTVAFETDEEHVLMYIEDGFLCIKISAQ
ncbi:MAG: hypothetical protein E7404_01830 [Ruminococcaceae bacterium]|nr:hypothetical protein [Oscillospiraceae bacterium]